MIIIKKDEWKDRQHEANGAQDIVLFNAGEPLGEHYIVFNTGDREWYTYKFMLVSGQEIGSYLTAHIAGTPLELYAELYDPSIPDPVTKYGFTQRLKILFTGKA